jgi:hypothetical protein
VRSLPSLGVLVTALTFALLALPAGAGASTVVIAFDPGGGPPPPGHARPATVFERLAARPDLSLGFMGATQGAYSRRQALLDMAAGTRVSRSGYDPAQPPLSGLRLTAGGGGRIARWAAVLRRAGSAPTEIDPGLLAGAVPGGAAYVAPEVAGAAAAAPRATGRVPGNLEAVLAADRVGRVAAVRLVPPARIAGEVAAQARERRLVVVTLPPGAAGDAALDGLRARRGAGDLLVVIRRPPRSRATQMLPMGVAGLRPQAGHLTSRTTRREGLIAGTDLLPTALGRLGIAEPPHVQGRPMAVEGTRDAAALRRIERRLRVVYPRRFPALAAVAASLAALSLALALLGGPRGRRTALRTAGLALLWVPGVALLTAALAPSRDVELLLMGPGTVSLALLTDRLVRWPRAAAAPALLGTAAYAADLLTGSHLIVRSLLGPNPRFGSRFYGIGNELEATLPLLLLVGIAAAAGAAPRSRRLAACFGAPMLVLGLIVGSGRFGADVGGVITTGAAAAVAVLFALPGRPSRRAIALTLCVPVAALAALAGLDLLTGGDAHFSRTVLHADGPGAVAGTIERRYQLAWHALLRGLMPLVTLLCAGAAVLAVRRRGRLYRPVAGHPAWSAALAGGLAGAVAGAVSNDSGPVLLVIGVVVLAAATAYVRGAPAASTPEPDGPANRTLTD